MTIPYDTFPAPHLVDGLRRYIERGITPGGFMSAVLCGDLYGAALRADDESIDALYRITRWLWLYAPDDCRGNECRFEDWIARGGLIGREDQA